MRIEPICSFEGYPENPSGESTFFVQGKIADVPAEFGKLVIGKGLAREIKESANASE